MRTLRPVLTHLAGLPFPPDSVFAAVERLSDELAEVRELLVDPATTSVRLVLTPESVVVAEARRTLTSLSLYGYRVDGVVANRVFPDDDACSTRWRAGWVEASAAAAGRGRVRRSRACRSGRSAYAAAEPVGLAALVELRDATYGDVDDPLRRASRTPDPLIVERVSTDEFVMSVALPHAERRRRRARAQGR